MTDKEGELKVIGGTVGREVGVHHSTVVGDETVHVEEEVHLLRGGGRRKGCIWKGIGRGGGW